MSIMSCLFLILPSIWSFTYAADNGMDMSMDGGMSLASGSMVPYLHFTLGDTLWFQGWVPKSRGAMVGACFGLFLLAILDRWIAAIRATAEVYWRKRAQIALSNRLNIRKHPNPESGSSHSSLKGSSSPAVSLSSLTVLRSTPPFIPAQDISRGLLHAAQAALVFAFMLAVMTFQVGFILSIVVGLGVGETLFGRYISASALH